MKNFISILILSLTLSACNNNPEIQIQFDNAGGLTSESSVYVNGLKVGDVNNLSLNSDNKVIVKVTLEKELPNDSKFYRSSSDFLGGSSLEVKPGKSKENFKEGDLVIGLVGGTGSRIDTLGIKLIDKINTVLSAPTKQDSLLIEVRRLNDNLEKMQNKK